MGWPLGGNWDRATTPPGASTADLSVVMAALCHAWYERANMLGSTPPQFNYTSDLSLFKADPVASDFNASLRVEVEIAGTPYGDLPARVRDQCKDALLSFFDGSGSMFYTDATCTTRYSFANIYADVNAVYPGSVTGSGRLVPWWQADRWLGVKEILNRCIYGKVAGVPTDLRPFLTDQT